MTHVHLDEGARDVLRELHRASRQARRAPAATTASAAVPVPIATASVPITVDATGSRAERLDALRKQAANWAPAKALGSLRDTMVFSVGNPDAKVMLVGEAPGYQEERQQEPFVGPAGQQLDKILLAMGLKREDVYISNIVKFRPLTPNQTTNNRKPNVEEMACCLPFVRAEIEIVQPACIIALGATAAEGLLGTSRSVQQLRGAWHAFSGVPVRVTYHPSYLLRSTSANQDKRRVWEDMLAVMELLAMPISEKQRGYFKK